MGFFKEVAIQSKHEVTERKQWHEIDGDYGLEYFPVDRYTRIEALKAYPKVHIRDVKVVEGFGARLSPTNGLQGTAWMVFKTRPAAIEYLDTTFGPEENGCG